MLGPMLWRNVQRAVPGNVGLQRVCALSSKGSSVYASDVAYSSARIPAAGGVANFMLRKPGQRVWRGRRRLVCGGFLRRASGLGPEGRAHSGGDLAESSGMGRCSLHAESRRALRKGEGPAAGCISRLLLVLPGRSPGRFLGKLRAQLPPPNLVNIESTIDGWQPNSVVLKVPKEGRPGSENLFAALDNRDIQAFRTALETSAEYARNAVNPSGTPIIFLAIAVNDPDFVRALSSKASGPDRNAELRNGMTPMHIAAGLGNRAIVEMLISEHFPSAI